MARAFTAALHYLLTSARQWPQSAFTTCALIYPTSLAAPVLISSVYGSSNAYLQFIGNTNGSVSGRIHQVKDSTYIGRVTNASAISTNTWFHVAVTWSGGTTNAAVKVYINGTQADTTNDGAGSFSAPYSGSDLQFEISGQGTGGNTFLGNIAEVGMWDAALDASEVAALSKNYSPALVRSGNLFGYWPLMGRTSPEIELTGNVGGATLSNTSQADHPRIIMPRKKKANNLRAPTPPAPPLRAQIWM